MVNYIIAVLLLQYLCQQLPGAHNSRGRIPRYGIHKILLGMGVINQDLRHIRIFCNRHGFAKQGIQVQTGGAGLRGSINGIKFLNQRVKILIIAPVVFLASSCRPDKAELIC